MIIRVFEHKLSKMNHELYVRIRAIRGDILYFCASKTAFMMKKPILRGNALATALLASVLLLSSCYSHSKLVGGSVRAVADSVWVYSIQHPDGFTMNLATMTEPSQGVVVAYAATQGCHSRKQLGRVVRHAIRHDGYVGGWLDTSDSLYYFDSSRLFPEDSLAAAIRFGIENGQIAIFILSEGREVRLEK